MRLREGFGFIERAMMEGDKRYALITAASTTGGIIAAGRCFLAKKDMIIKRTFQGISIPGHFFSGEVASFPGANLRTSR
jgi:hypothetical protein